MDNKKRIFIITRHGSVEIGGIEKYLFDWLKHINPNETKCTLCLQPGIFSNKIQKLRKKEGSSAHK